MKIPLIDLHPVTTECQIAVSVGEAMDSNCAGTLTITIVNGNGNGNHLVLNKEVTNLSHETQKVYFEETPRMEGIFPVIAILVLDSGESKSDQTEYIKLCNS